MLARTELVGMGVAVRCLLPLEWLTRLMLRQSPLLSSTTVTEGNRRTMTFCVSDAGEGTEAGLVFALGLFRARGAEGSFCAWCRVGVLCFAGVSGSGIDAAAVSSELNVLVGTQSRW